MDINSVKILNPWLENKEAIQQDFHLIQILGKPYYFNNPIKKELILEPDHTFILRGSRQVGKTTLLKGKIFEAVVANHLAKIHSPLYYWYSSNLKKEVDILIKEGDHFFLFDVKSQPEGLKYILGREVKAITPCDFQEQFKTLNAIKGA